jgi:hypothetical protein
VSGRARKAASRRTPSASSASLADGKRDQSRAAAEPCRRRPSKFKGRATHPHAGSPAHRNLGRDRGLARPPTDATTRSPEHQPVRRRASLSTSKSGQDPSEATGQPKTTRSFTRLGQGRSRAVPARAEYRSATNSRPAGRTVGFELHLGCRLGTCAGPTGRADFPSADTPTRTPSRESTRTLTGRRHVEGQGDQCSDGEVATPMV